MSWEMIKYGFRIDREARILHTPVGTHYFPPYSTKAQCMKAIRGKIRLIEESKKITHEIVAEKIQDKLL